MDTLITCMSNGLQRLYIDGCEFHTDSQQVDGDPISRLFMIHWPRLTTLQLANCGLAFQSPPPAQSQSQSQVQLCPFPVLTHLLLVPEILSSLRAHGWLSPMR